MDVISLPVAMPVVPATPLSMPATPAPATPIVENSPREAFEAMILQLFSQAPGQFPGGVVVDAEAAPAKPAVAAKETPAPVIPAPKIRLRSPAEREMTVSDPNQMRAAAPVPVDIPVPISLPVVAVPTSEPVAEDHPVIPVAPSVPAAPPASAPVLTVAIQNEPPMTEVAKDRVETSLDTARTSACTTGALSAAAAVKEEDLPEEITEKLHVAHDAEPIDIAPAKVEPPVVASHRVEPPRAVAAPAPVEEKSAPPPVRSVALEFAPDGARDVRVRLAERGGEVHVSVHTADPVVTRNLQDGVTDLANVLAHAGYDAHAWTLPREGQGQQQPREERTPRREKRTEDTSFDGALEQGIEEVSQ